MSVDQNELKTGNRLLVNKVKNIIQQKTFISPGYPAIPSLDMVTTVENLTAHHIVVEIRLGNQVVWVNCDLQT